MWILNTKFFRTNLVNEPEKAQEIYNKKIRHNSSPNQYQNSPNK